MARAAGVVIAPPFLDEVAGVGRPRGGGNRQECPASQGDRQEHQQHPGLEHRAHLQPPFEER